MGFAIAATDDAITAGGLGLVERLIGIVEPKRRVGVRRGESGQADAQAYLQRRVLFVTEGGEAITQGIHGRSGAVEREVRKNHAELVTAVAAGHVSGAKVLFEHLAQLTQDDIPGDMAVSVVDGFEVIDVDQSDRPAPVLAFTALEFDFQLVLPGTVIEQAGETVGTAQGEQFALLPAKRGGLAKADPAQRQRVQTQQGQTGV